jgi:hypothetical protein
MNTRVFGAVGLACAMSMLGVSTTSGAAGGPGAGGMFGGMSRTAKLTGAMTKVFGEHSSFSADVENQTSGDKPATIPGKLAFDQGKSRFEMDLTQAKGGGMDPQMSAQMATMGMDKMVTISRPDKNTAYIIYPTMKAYIEAPIDPSENPSDQKLEVTTKELGKETVDGRPAIKNKVTVKEGANKVLEATVWNATDLKKFPVKIEHQAEGGSEITVTTLFKNVKLEKPAASQFEVPQGFQKYNGMMELMQAMMMKQGGGMQMPPAGVPKQRKK